MGRYSVDVMLPHLTTEVEADDEDDALTAAAEGWISQAVGIIYDGTFGVREVAAGVDELPAEPFESEIVAPVAADANGDDVA